MVFVCGFGMKMVLLVIFLPGRERNEKLKDWVFRDFWGLGFWVFVFL